MRNGLISFDEVCRRYQQSAEEFLEWQQAMKADGVKELSVTRRQHYCDIPGADDAWRAAAARACADRLVP